MTIPVTQREEEVTESPVGTFVRGWNKFWFSPADPTPLALVRICAGLVVLYIHLAYSYDLQGFFGANAWINLAELNDFRRDAPWQERHWHDWQEMPNYEPPGGDNPEADKTYMLKWDGLNPRLAHAKGYYSWSIWYHVTDPFWMQVVHCFNLLVFFCLIIGFCTRVTSVLAWLAAMSYIQRSPTTLFGVDTIMNLVLIYLMIGPSGAALSVDRLIQRYAKAWGLLRARGSARKVQAADALASERPAPSISANLALRLLQVHVCFVYMASGLSKLQGNAWWQGTSTWATMANYEFSPVHFAPYAAYLRYLCQHRWLWEVVMQGGVLFTLVFEIAFAFAVWNRWLRWPMILGAVLLHTGIAIFMGLTTFSLMMLSAVASFVPAASIYRLLDNMGRGPGTLRLFWAGRSRSQVRAASLIHAFDVWNQIRLTEPAAEAAWTKTPAEVPRLQLVTEKRDILTGYPLFERVTRSLPLLWPLAVLTWIPGVTALGKGWFPGDEHQPMTALDRESEKGRTKSEKVPS
jgi:hypothetical protein